VRDEIKEREKCLEEMKQLGQLNKQTERRIRDEIQQRVYGLEALDKLINSRAK